MLQPFLTQVGTSIALEFKNLCHFVQWWVLNLVLWAFKASILTCVRNSCNWLWSWNRGLDQMDLFLLSSRTAYVAQDYHQSVEDPLLPKLPVMVPGGVTLYKQLGTGTGFWMFSDQKSILYEAGDGFLALLADVPMLEALFSVHHVLFSVLSYAVPPCRLLPVPWVWSQSNVCQSSMCKKVWCLYITLHLMTLRETWWAFSCSQRTKRFNRFLLPTAWNPQIHIYLDCIMLECLIFRLLFKLLTWGPSK